MRPEKLRLRPAEEGDAGLMHAWVNEPSSLVGKLRTDGPIPWPEHASWFAMRLLDADARIWIAELADEPVGQIRVERRADAIEIDIYVTPPFRRRGLGETMLASARSQVRALWPKQALRARVRRGNVASQRLFERAGYRLTEAKDDHIVLERSA